MSNEQIERATTSTADMVAAGLEQHARAITARVISILDEYRAHSSKDMDDMQTMLTAVANQLAEQGREASIQRAEMTAAVRGLSQQLSEYEALVPPAERVKAIATIEEHEKRLNRLETDVAKLKARE